VFKVIKIYSRQNPNQLLHLVVDLNDIASRVDFMDSSDVLQIGAVKKLMGDRPHPHWHKRKFLLKKTRVQESWFVYRGEVLVSHFDVDETLLDRQILTAGFLNVTLKGGHTFEVLSDSTIILEHKLGPYKGLKKDKVQFTYPE
jgi:hypothetical protein